jgi:uncharacterized protein YdeI (YjbR/CyaY-like superfamily)
MAKKGVQRFKALLEKDNSSLGWTIAHVPFDPAKAWKQMIRSRVRGTVNGFAFRTSLFPDPAGGFFLLVNRATQAGAGVSLGSNAEIMLEPDLEAREAELPDELAVLLDDEPGLRDWYDGLTEYTRREIGKWVLGVKGDEALMRRAQQMAERLLATMEAELELPPAIEAAFRAKPKARAGWAAMTALQRRAELMAYFYYRTPESQQKRLGKTIEACLAKAT